ncbi:MAG: hypothetical protein AAF889_08030 [Cyanobacteria bacterium P01_D01_bin.73]
MAAPIGIKIIAAIFYLFGAVTFMAGFYLLFVVVLGSDALVLTKPLTAAFPNLEAPFEKLTLELSSADSGPVQALAIAMMVFGLASSFLSVSSGLTSLQNWSRTLTIVFCVIGIANGLARICDPMATGLLAWAYATGIFLLILLYLCSPGVAAMFTEGSSGDDE